MDKASGQLPAARRSAGARTPVSAPTRERLMTAAAELIAELGWGRVTTRAVAERAGLPHGSVSYHFRGKQELLIESAMYGFQQAIPVAAFEAMTTVKDLIDLIAAEVTDYDAIDPVLSRLMLETMREAERDPALREQMGASLGEYRRLMVKTVRADQKRGKVFTGASADALATLLAALGDGLMLHVLLDPELDVAGAIAALRKLLGTRGSAGSRRG